MSLKIYNGKKLDVDSFADLWIRIGRLRTQIMQEVMNQKAKFIAEAATALHDRIVANALIPGEETDGGPYTQAAMHLFRSDDYCYGGGSSRTDKYSYPDFTLEMVIFFYAGKFYALPYVHNKVLTEILNNQNWIQDFAYWNNTDRPEELPEDAWDDRGNIWDGILDSCHEYVPAAGGMSFQLSPRNLDLPTWFQIGKHIPSFEERIGHLAQTIVQQKWSEERYHQLKLQYGDAHPPMHEYMVGFGAARKKDPQWDLLIASERERISQILPEIITPQMLGFPEHRLSKELSV